MCRKYQARKETLTLKEVTIHLKNKATNTPPPLPPTIVYSKQEIVSATKVLERLAARIPGPIQVI